MVKSMDAGTTCVHSNPSPTLPICMTLATYLISLCLSFLFENWISWHIQGTQRSIKCLLLLLFLKRVGTSLPKEALPPSSFNTNQQSLSTHYMPSTAIGARGYAQVNEDGRCPHWAPSLLVIINTPGIHVSRSPGLKKWGRGWPGRCPQNSSSSHECGGRNKRKC